ncbi:MAG: hypothetical protein MJ117_02615 [Lachnospiraceae bacterium]|nr:hypothetical protein [Lachnospiraceae bacterium]
MNNDKINFWIKKQLQLIKRLIIITMLTGRTTGAVRKGRCGLVGTE